MGSRRDGESGPEGLPEEWGRVVIPDDAAELDDLADAVRAELAEEQWRLRNEHRLPYVVLAIAVGIALLSLVLVFWLARAGMTQPREPADETESPATSETAEPSEPRSSLSTLGFPQYGSYTQARPRRLAESAPRSIG